MDVKFVNYNLRTHLFQNLLSKSEEIVELSIKNNCLKKKFWRWIELFSWLKEHANLPSFMNEYIAKKLLKPNEESTLIFFKL